MTVDILGCAYRVKLTKMSEDIHGECNTDKKVIKINKRHKKDRNKTFVHEVLHGIFHESGLTFLLDGNLEEALVRAVEHGLTTTTGLIEEIDYEQFLDENAGKVAEDVETY